MTDLTQWVRHMLGNGVHPNFGDELEVTGTSSPLSVGYGAAIVNGFPFYADSDDDPYSVTVPTPSIGTTGHSIVVRADWPTQTVRFAVRSSADGNGAFPAVVVTEGVVSEILLAHASITTGGVITVTDAREWLHYRTKVDSTMLDTGVALLNIGVGGIDPSYLQNRTRTILIPASGGYNFTDLAAVPTFAATVAMEADKQTSVYGVFQCPKDYIADGVITPIIYASVAGNMRITADYIYGAVGQTFDTHNDNEGEATHTLVVDTYYAPHTTDLSFIDDDDIVTCTATRFGLAALDTLASPVYCIGFRFTYTADS
jgi:hypothetical protein